MGSSSTMLEVDEDGVSFEFLSMALPAYSRNHNPEYFQIWADQGKFVARSPTLGERDLQHPVVKGQTPVSWDLLLPDGRQGRAMAVPLVSMPEEPDEELPAGQARQQPVTALLVVARGREPLDKAISSLLLGVFGALAGSCVVIVLLVRLTIRRGLRPLVRLGEQVDAIDAANLSTRLPVEDQPREVRPVALELNELLARMEAAFGRERRMTASMAHELRTPISELRSATDVAARWPDDEELKRDALETAREVSDRMGRVVESLLLLSRAESGREVPEQEPCDLGEVIRALWKRYEPRLVEKQIHLDQELPRGLVVRTDRDLLELLLRNLVENAAEHTPVAGRIASRLSNGSAEVVWKLVNSPVDLDPGDLPRLAEPLWTKEESRCREDHSGLGLTLAAALARVIDAGLGFSLEDRGLAVSLRLRRTGAGETDGA